MQVKDLQFLINGFNEDCAHFLQVTKPRSYQPNELELMALVKSELLNFVEILGTDKERSLTIKELYDLSKIIMQTKNLAETPRNFADSVNKYFPIQGNILDALEALGILNLTVIELFIKKNISDTAIKTLRPLREHVDSAKKVPNSQMSAERSAWYFNSIVKNSGIIDALAKMTLFLLNIVETKIHFQLHPAIFIDICAIATSSKAIDEFVSAHETILSEFKQHETILMESKQIEKTKYTQSLINQFFSLITQFANRAESLNSTVEILRLKQRAEDNQNLIDKKEKKQINCDESTSLAVEMKDSAQFRDYQINYKASSLSWWSHPTHSTNLDSENLMTDQEVNQSPQGLKRRIPRPFTEE